MSISTGRKVLAIFLLAPFVLFALSDAIGPDTGDGNSTTDQLNALHKIAAHKGAFLTAGVLSLIGAILLIVATYAIVHVYRGRKLGVGQVAGGLIAMGMAVFFAWYAFGTMQYEMVNHAEFQNPANQNLFAQLLHFGNNSGAGSPLLIVFLIGIVLGPVLLGVAMIRRRNVPLWSAILLILAGVVGFFVQSSAANVVLMLVNLVALAPLALSIWNMTDEEWDAPREVAGARRARPAPPVEPPVAAPAAAV